MTVPSSPKTPSQKDTESGEPQQDRRELEDAQEDAAEEREEEGGYQ